MSPSATIFVEDEIIAVQHEPHRYDARRTVGADDSEFARPRTGTEEITDLRRGHR